MSEPITTELVWHYDLHGGDGVCFFCRKPEVLTRRCDRPMLYAHEACVVRAQHGERPWPMILPLR